MQEKRPLTKRQKEVLSTILQFMAKNGHAPSFRELAALLGTDNVSTAQYFVDELQKKGHLVDKNKGAKGISPLNEPKTVPLLGFIAAGNPIEPLENPDDILVPNNVTFDSKYPHYALRIKGDSMIDMGILDGDTVLIRHQLTANPGDVVVAVTENGATLKIYRLRNGEPFLEARNANFPAIFPKELEIRGKFVGLIRTSEQYL